MSNPIKATKRPLTELATSDESFCIEYVNGEYILKKDYAYYYQVQLQMFLTQAKACYFFVYSREASLCQMILFDEVFLAEKVPVAKNVFVYAILPKLLGRWYSRIHVAPPKIKENVIDNQNTCTCRNQNIVSGTANCSDKTYHLSCLGLEVQPKGKWFCPYCARK